MAAQYEIDFIRDARNTAEMLLQAADLLERAWCSGAVEDEEPIEGEQKDAPPQPTFEELRGILADKARLGFREQIKEILTGYGVEKLSELPKEYYGVVMKQVKDFKDASC